MSRRPTPPRPTEPRATYRIQLRDGLDLDDRLVFQAGRTIDDGAKAALQMINEGSDVTAVQALWLVDLGVHLLGSRGDLTLLRLLQRTPTHATARVLGGDAIALAVLANGDEESSEVTHQYIDPSRSRSR